MSLVDRASSGRVPGLTRILGESRVLLGVGYALAIVLTAAGVVLASSPPKHGSIASASHGILVLLGFNLVLILVVAVLVAARMLRLLDAGDAGAKLRLRFVSMFAVAAVVPALVVALFFGVLVTRGVQSWLSQRVRTVVENSAAVARSYIDEQTLYVHDHLLTMAIDIDRTAGALQATPVRFNRFLAEQASYHAFTGVYLLDHDGRVLARAEADTAPPFVIPSASTFKAADEGDIPESLASSDQLRGLYKLPNHSDNYLYVVRPVGAGIVKQLREAEASLNTFRDSAQNQSRLQAAFALSYVETTLLLLVGAVWLGMSAADRVAAPVARLVEAAGRVSAGDLTVRVDAEGDAQDIAVLSHAFNRMTDDLQSQQAALKAASEDADSRRQFIETVLSGVSAGVLGVDAEGRISAVNLQAAVLLDLAPGQAVGRMLEDAAPELAPVAKAARDTGEEAEEEVDVARAAETRRLRVRATGLSDNDLVLTFDDITRLMAAQRNAAWKDVARRIAHEIKNPLTPIQLSAERLRRKYRKEITSDLETFDRCTDTIIRQVGDIGRMVDEFSAFARMPAPRFAALDATELLRQAVFAQRVASPEIDVQLEDPPAGVELMGDARMIGQALANILKNAAEAISARPLATTPQPKGRILARLLVEPGAIAFSVADNGVGLPTRDRERLTEPYVTTREKGTGLGLAIVKRIMEEHSGDLLLADAPQGPGAQVTLRFDGQGVRTASAGPLADATV
jgi:two-component system nitrogen regulation sensor histidine kinase NtrY